MPQDFSGNSIDPTFAPQPEPDDSMKDVEHALSTIDTILGGNATVAGAMQNNTPSSDNEAAANVMSDDDLKIVIKTKMENSHLWSGLGSSALNELRIKADQYYRGDLLGNEKEGRSKVVSRDVAEAIDAAMPSLMRVFTGVEHPCHFEALGEEHDAKAEQATDYINHLIMQDNQGFLLFWNWFKDALLHKSGIVKAHHETRTKYNKEYYAGLTLPQLQILQQDASLQVKNVVAYSDQVIAADPHGNILPGEPIELYNCVVCKAAPEKRIVITNVPPEEFVIEKRAASIDSANFLAQHSQRTLSDLIESGYDRDVVMDLPYGNESNFSPTKLQRFREESQLPFENDSALDPTMRKVWVTEAYIKCDYDGDGVAEWRCVVLAGDGHGSSSAILDNTEVSGHPFADLTFDPEPHKFYGNSVFEKLRDIQDIKTALLRGILDSTYLANSPRLGVVDGQANIDDLLDARAGGIVRLKSPNALVPLQAGANSQEALNVVAYMDNVKRMRTGLSMDSSGVSSNILTTSATGADIYNTNAQQKIELVCRIFAETGIKRLYNILFRLVCQYQDVPRVIKLRNKWVTVDPRDWKDKMYVVTAVTMGAGTKQQQAATAMQLLNLDKQIIEMQGGLDGQFLNADGIYNKLKKLIEAVGWKNVAPYYSDPKAFTPQEKQPSPEQELKRQELETDAIKAQTQKDIALANIQANRELKTLELQIKNLDYEIKKIELAALQYQELRSVSQRADNSVTTSTTKTGFMQGG